MYVNGEQIFESFDNFGIDVIYVFYFESQTSIYQNMRLDQYNKEGL